jgi:NADH-quinone oxidoreductase subunit A
MLGNYLAKEYLPLVIFFVVAVAFGYGLLLVGEIIRPRRPYREKLMPYESGSTFETGITPLIEPTRYRFSVRFYIIAMLFVVFDVEAIFLYPWALVFDRIGLYAYIEMFVFITILLVGYVYAWKKEAFRWD